MSFSALNGYDWTSTAFGTTSVIWIRVNVRVWYWLIATKSALLRTKWKKSRSASIAAPCNVCTTGVGISGANASESHAV